MRHPRSIAIATAAAAALTAAPSALGQSPAKSPDPITDPSLASKPSCNGLIVASFNHGSGAAGPSGNPTASSGPGSFFGPGTHEAIETLARGAFCTS